MDYMHWICSGGGSGKQSGASVGELHVGAALVHPDPAECDSALGPGPEVVATASCCKKRRVDAFDINPTVLHGLVAVSRSRMEHLKPLFVRANLSAISVCST